MKRGKTTLASYRGALYSGIGLSGAGVLVALIFCRVPKPSIPQEEKKPSIVCNAPAAASDTVTDTHAVQGVELEGEFPIISRF